MIIKNVFFFPIPEAASMDNDSTVDVGHSFVSSSEDDGEGMRKFLFSRFSGLVTEISESSELTEEIRRRSLDDNSQQDLPQE